MADGLLIERVGRVTVFTFTNSSDEGVERWAMEFDHTIANTPEDDFFYVLVDVSSPQVSFTRLARQKSIALFTRYRMRQGRVAFLFSSKTAPHYARIFFASLGRLHFQLQFFSNREKALDWLRQ